MLSLLVWVKRKMKNNFKTLLEEILTEKKSVMSFLKPDEIKSLQKVFKAVNPAVALQELDETPLFDKLLQHFLGNRSVASIPALKDGKEGDWLINQLEFDDKFMTKVGRLV